MNTSLFVGLCCDAGLEVEFSGTLAEISTHDRIKVATIDERADSLYWVDTYDISREQAAALSELVPKYALTPIEGRE